MPAPRIPIAGPWITDLEIGYVAEAVATNWYEHANDFIGRFESAFGAHIGRRHAIALPSCTAALHLALLGLGIGPGDEVIVPDATWIASSAPISYVGAEPRFADIDRTTWCIDVASVERLITDRTRAIVPVDLYGGMPDHAALQALADRRGIVIVEDAAEAIGSTIEGVPAGRFGVASTFSFHGSKTVTTGEGGMLLVDDDALHDRILVTRDHGRRRGDVGFFNDEVAHKYKMSSLQAALGLAQIERVAELVDRKRDIFGWYRDRLGADDRVVLNAEPAGTRNSYWMITVVVDPAVGLGKAELGDRLRASNIDTRPFFHPLSSIPAYREADDTPRAARENTVSYDVSARGLNLPSALSLTEEQVERVCRALTAELDRGGRR